MNSPKHSPGDWKVERDHDNRLIVQSGTVTVCLVGHDVLTAQADADLIAAAPKLLAALKISLQAVRVCHSIDCSREEQAEARMQAEETAAAAITQAEGGAL